MKLVVLGPTGRIGREVVRAALAAGHTVTAVARDPGAVGQAHENLTVTAGDVFDADSLDGAIASADAVVFAVGTRGQGPTVTRSTGVATVAKVMRAAGVARLLVVSPSAAFISPRAPLTRKLALRYVVHKIYRNPFNDVERMEDELRHSGLDWSVVRAPALRPGPATGAYEVVPDGRVRRERPVSTADLAGVLLTRAADPSTHGTTVTVVGPA